MFNSTSSWGWPTRIIHWVSAGAILFMLGLGFYMVEVLPSDGGSDSLIRKIPYYQLHKSWGFVVFALAVLRVVWRALNRRRPGLPAGMPGWERAAAHGAHIALYVLIFALPVSGWLMVSASTLQDMGMVKNMVFGVFHLPDPFTPGDRGIEELCKSIHFYLTIALALVLAAHVGGALKHHFVARDDVLRRMTTGG